MAAKPSVKSKPTTAKKPAAAAPKAKDLPAKKNAKGGGIKRNHNETWVHA
jgi:hypothetical protein